MRVFEREGRFLRAVAVPFGERTFRSDAMPEAAARTEQASTRRAVASLALLCGSGILSGAIVGCLSGLAELFLFYREALPFAWENGLMGWLLTDTLLINVPNGALA